jgi:hypothetical protein
MAFRSSTSGLSSASPIVATAPPGLASGDQIVIMIDGRGDTPTNLSGFTAWATFTTSGGSHGRSGNYWYCTKLAGSEPGSYSITMTGGSGNYKYLVGCWSGRNATLGSAIVTNSAGAVPGNGVTPFTCNVPTTGYTSVNGDDVCVLIALADTNTAGSWAITNALGFTDQVDINDVGTFRGGELNLSYLNAATAGQISGSTLAFTCTGTSLVASAGGDTATVVIPLASGTPPVLPVPPYGPMPKQIYVMP